MKVSKVVLVVVALHVLVIGGIFIFEGCSRSRVQAPDMAENESIPASTNITDNPMPMPAGPDAIARMTPPTLAPAAGPEVVPGAQINPVAPIAPVTPARTYAVKKGDSLTRIARLEKTTVAELAKANNLTKTSTLKIGQKLTIPSAVTAVATATPVMPVTALTADATTATAPVAGSAYEVKSGDSLWKIAHANHTTVPALKQANGLTSDALKIGQKLTIPATTAVASTGGTMPAVEPALGASAVSNGQTVHVVNIGEYPGVIAKKYGVSVVDLLKANNITDARKVRAGAKLVIPVAAPVAPSAPVADPAATVSSAPIATASAN